MELFHKKYIIDPNSRCFLWQASKVPNGYGQFSFDGRLQLAHRVAWQLHNGPIPDGLLVLHKCDVRACVNPAHLFVGTAKDNSVDMVRKGRCKLPGLKGQDHPKAKLSDEQVYAIREDGRAKRTIAGDYGITRKNVSEIKLRHTWKHLPERMSRAA